MNLERVFDSILRIYPKSFRERFGEELELGFQDELNAHPSKLELAKLLVDTFTSAVWERMQATKWIYWLFAISTVLFFLASGIIVIFPNVNDQIYASIAPFTAFFIIATPLVFLMRLERMPSRLEWIGMIICYNPIILFWINSIPLNLAFWLNFLAPLGYLLFAISYQGIREMPLPVRLLKLGLGLLAVTMIVNNMFMGRIASLSEWLSSALGQFNSISIMLCIGFIVVALLWKPRAVAMPSS